MRGTIALVPTHSIMKRSVQARQSAPALLLVLLTLTGVAAAADDDRAPEPVYMTGAEVRIDRQIDGDLIAAAGRIQVSGRIGGDAILGAGSLDLNAPVEEDLRAAAGFVAIGSHIRGQTMIAAGRITVGPEAELHGYAWLAGSHVTLGGTTLSSTKVYGRVVSIEGQIYGPLEIIADRVEIRGSARIYGDVVYSADQAIVIDPIAKVSGRLSRTGHNAAAREGDTAFAWIKPLRPLLLASLLAAGFLLYALLPGFVRRSVQMLASTPAKSLALGTALFFSVPPVIVLLLITIIGIPLAIFVAACHVLALLAGYLIAGFYIGDGITRALNRPRGTRFWNLLFFAGALILLALIANIPYAGPVLWLLAISAGLGAMLLQAFSRDAASAKSHLRNDAWPAA